MCLHILRKISFDGFRSAERRISPIIKCEDTRIELLRTDRSDKKQALKSIFDNCLILRACFYNSALFHPGNGFRNMTF